MKCDIPELRELWRELWEAVEHSKGTPLHSEAWTGYQGIFQHINGRAELLPQSGAKRPLTPIRCSAITVLSLFSSFLTCYHKSGSR